MCSSDGPAIDVALLWLVRRFARAEDDLWTSDFAAAKAKAKAEKKSLLVDFTGSDWCVWCKSSMPRFSTRIFSKPKRPKQFVLVELDYPHAKKLPDEVEAQNKKLAKDYKIHGYPTVLLLDAEGQLIAHTGYQPGGPEKYMAQLGDFSKTYEGVLEMRQALETTQGLDRAKLLDQLVAAYDKLDNPVDDVPAWSKEIVALDADNKAGLKSKYEFRIVLAEADRLAGGAKVMPRRSRPSTRVWRLPGITGEQKQEIYLKQDWLRQEPQGPGRSPGLPQDGP